MQALSGRLRHHLDQQDSGHNGETWEMIEEQLVVRRHGFESMDGAARLKRNDAI